MAKSKFIRALLKGYAGKYLFTMFLNIIAASVPVATGYIIKIIVDKVIIGKNYSIFSLVLGAYIASTLIRLILWYYVKYSFENIGQHAVLNLREKGYKQIMSLDFNFFDTHRTGDIMTQMTADVEMVRHLIVHIAPTFVENIVLFLGAICFMLAVCDASFLVLLLVVIPMTVYMSVKLKKTISPCYKNIREMRSKLNTIAQENISANRVVKAFGREEFENEKLEKINANFKEAQLKTNKVARRWLPFISNVSNIFVIYNIVVGGILVINGEMTLGQLVMFNGMVWMITGPLTNVGFLTNEFANSMASIEKVDEFLNIEPDIVNDAKVIKESIDGNFEFKNVVFDYKNEGALRDVSFKVEKGQKVAIVGATGSGKSTIINLISRFYEAKSGEVLVDGVDVKDIDLGLLRSSIAAAQQDVFLFSETVAKNIAYGDTVATEEEIKEAAKLAEAHEFIEELPEGYETIIGERGVGLSGGQKQRLTLARALLKKPSVLVLDDTTSALDAETEKYIQHHLDTYFKDKTVFIISQRISSVKDCDLILVMEDGKLTEMGKHEQLIKNKGYYYNVFSHQFGEFKRGEA